MQFFKGGSGYKQGQTPYDIFKDRMTAISSMVTSVRDMILRKYHKGLFETYLSTVNKEIDETQQKEITNLFSTDPDDIYGDVEATVTQFVDKEMGMMMKKEIMMGRLPSVAPKAKTSEVMIPKSDSQEFLNAIQSLPQDKRDWTSVTAYMEENRPRFMGSSSPMETQIMGQILGEPSQRDQYMKDIKDAKILRDFYAEPKPEKVTSRVDMFMRYPERWLMMMEMEAKFKGEDRTAWEIQIDQMAKWLDEGAINKEQFLKGAGMYVTPEKKTQFEMEFDILMQTDPSNNEVKKWLGAYITPKTPEGEKDLSSTDINLRQKLFYEGEDGWGTITPEQYEEASTTYGKRKNKPEHLDILEKALQYCLDLENKIIIRGEDNKKTEEFFEAYEWIYPYYKDALKGEEPKYLPPEEIKKVGFIEGALGGDVARGDYGSALVADQQGKQKDEKGYIVGETYRDEEGVLWKYLGNGKFEEVEEEKKSQKRTR